MVSRVFWFLLIFFVIFRLMQGLFRHFKRLNIIKKKALTCATHDGSCAIQKAHARPSDYQIPQSRTVLGATHHSFSGDMACAYDRDTGDLQRTFFFLFLFFLLAQKFAPAHPKNNCVLQSILTLILLITISFAFDAFLILDFFQFHPCEFYLILFLYSILSLFF